MASHSWRTLALILCATLALLTGCGTSTGGTGGTTSGNGSIKLEPICNNLDGLNGNLTPTGSYTTTFAKDGDGLPITIPAKPPQRIVSLTPVDSEIVAALGASSRLVGIDHFTNYPASILNLPVVTTVSGFTSKVNVEKVLSLNPDLVLSYGGETATIGDATLRKAGLNVISIPTADLTGTLGDIFFAGQVLGAQQQANTLVARMETCINTIKTAVQGKTDPSVYMEIDYSTPGKPYTVDKGSFEDQLIADAGGANIFGSDTSGFGYPQVSDETIIADNPQVIFLSEPVTPALQKPQDRAAWKSVSAVQNSRIFIINDDLLSRPGPRIVNGLAAIAEDLWPTLFG